MSFAASILIILPLLLSIHCCQSLIHIPPEKARSNSMNAMQASYLAPLAAEGHMVKNNDDDMKSILVKNEQSMYFMGSKGATDGSAEEHNEAEMRYKSMRGWRKLVVFVSETKAMANAGSSHGARKRKRSPGIDIDYAPPKTHPPKHN